jgi:hypothetical protein
MSRARVMQMVRSVEEVAVQRAKEQTAPVRLLDPGCRGACSRLRAGLRGDLRGRPATGLVAVLARLPSDDLRRLDDLGARTRVPRATYLREAVVDLLVKYGGTP